MHLFSFAVLFFAYSVQKRVTGFNINRKFNMFCRMTLILIFRFCLCLSISFCSVSFVLSLFSPWNLPFVWYLPYVWYLPHTFRCESFHTNITHTPSNIPHSFVNLLRTAKADWIHIRYLSIRFVSNAIMQLSFMQAITLSNACKPTSLESSSIVSIVHAVTAFLNRRGRRRSATGAASTKSLRLRKATWWAIDWCAATATTSLSSCSYTKWTTATGHRGTNHATCIVRQSTVQRTFIATV